MEKALLHFYVLLLLLFLSIPVNSRYLKFGGHNSVSVVSPSKALPKAGYPSRFTVDIDTVINNELYRVGIDLNNTKYNAYVKLTDTKVIQAWVDYDPCNNQLEMRLSSNSSKPTLPILSWNVDTINVGFSASTGVVAKCQYTLSWSFKVNGEAISLDLETLPSLPGSADESDVCTRMFRAALCLLAVLLILTWIRVFEKFEGPGATQGYDHVVDLGHYIKG